MSDSLLFDYQYSIGQSSCSSNNEIRAKALSRKVGSSHYVALSLGRHRSPVLFSVIRGSGRLGIASQIAVKMCLSSIVDEALRFGVAYSSTDIPCDESFPLEIVRAGFKEANRQLYEYSHRMRAGGKISATGVIGVYDGIRVSIGQVGGYESFLWRKGKLFRFYDSAPPVEGSASSERFIGMQSNVLVELASVNVEKDDLLVLTTMGPGESFLSAVKETLGKMESLDSACDSLAEIGLKFSSEDAVVCMIKAGAPTIDLRNIVFDELE